MLFFDGGLALLFAGLWLFCIIDVITTPDGACRNLPKLVWLFLVVFLLDIGAIVWLVAGRPWAQAPQSRAGAPVRPGSRFPKYERVARPVATNPDDDEEFLAGLRARAEEQRRRARDAQRAEDGPPDDATP